MQGMGGLGNLGGAAGKKETNGSLLSYFLTMPQAAGKNRFAVLNYGPWKPERAAVIREA